MGEAVLFAALLPGALRPGQGVRGRGVVRERLPRHAAGGPGGAELQEAADHPGVPGAGALRAAREEGCAGAGGEVRYAELPERPTRGEGGRSPATPAWGGRSPVTPCLGSRRPWDGDPGAAPHACGPARSQGEFGKRAGFPHQGPRRQSG